MSADFAPHLIVPFAHCSGDDWLQAVSSVELGNLGKLLRGMDLLQTNVGQADSLSPPHERVLAKGLGIALTPAGEGQRNAASPHPRPFLVGEGVFQDGLIPWAAREAKAKPNEGWAFITPCHWAMGREHATLTDPATLDLSEADSRTLLAAMQPYFATECITLHYLEPVRWLASGAVFETLPTASLNRVMGRNVDRWLPASTAMKLLQNEMQMLLYTHPVNDERAARGQRSVNSFWISGSGALPDATANPAKVNVNSNLIQAAFGNDWAAYSAAWAQLDAIDIKQLLGRQNKGESVRVSLCGESNAMTFQTAPRSIFRKLKRVFSPQRPIDVLKQL